MNNIRRGDLVVETMRPNNNGWAPYARLGLVLDSWELNRSGRAGGRVLWLSGDVSGRPGTISLNYSVRTEVWGDRYAGKKSNPRPDVLRAGIVDIVRITPARAKREFPVNYRRLPKVPR